MLPKISDSRRHKFNAVCKGLAVLLLALTLKWFPDADGQTTTDASLFTDNSQSKIGLSLSNAFARREQLTAELRSNLAISYNDLPLCIQLCTQTIQTAEACNDVAVAAVARMQRSLALLRNSGFEDARHDFEQAIPYEISRHEPELGLLFQIPRATVELSVNRSSDRLGLFEDFIEAAEGVADPEILDYARFELMIAAAQSGRSSRRSGGEIWTLAAISAPHNVQLTELSQLRELKQKRVFTSEHSAEHASLDTQILRLPAKLRLGNAPRRFEAEAELLAASVQEEQGRNEAAVASLNNARTLLADAGDLSLAACIDSRIAAVEQKQGQDKAMRSSLSRAMNDIHLITLPPVLSEMMRTGSQDSEIASQQFSGGSRLSAVIQTRMGQIKSNGLWLREAVQSSQTVRLQAMLDETAEQGANLTNELDSVSEARQFYLRVSGIGFLASLALAAFLLRERKRLRKLNERLLSEIEARETASRERERMELHLAQSARLDSLGDLAGGIAHDFNNLLVGVLGNAELLRYSNQVSGNATEYLDGITKSAETAAELSRKMLAYAGKQPAQKTAVELNTLVEKMLPLFRPGSGTPHKIMFIPSAQPVYTEADEGQLEQILLNLVTNSVHAVCQSRGTISIQVGTETIDDVASDPFLFGHRKTGGDFSWFEISDDGSGIVDSELARVFEPFYSTKPRTSSHGFGLAVVYGHVNRHNGLIRLTSTTDVGTKFRILLPRQSEFHALQLPPTTVAPQQANSNPLSVVIVDDQLSVLQVAERSLQSHNWTVHCFSSASDAMEFLSDEPDVNCLVIDLIMPGITGAVMLEELEQRGLHIPVVVMSGYSPTDIDDLRRFPTIASFLQKPFRPEELQQAISAAVSCPPVPFE